MGGFLLGGSQQCVRFSPLLFRSLFVGLVVGFPSNSFNPLKVKLLAGDLRTAQSHFSHLLDLVATKSFGRVGVPPPLVKNSDRGEHIPKPPMQTTNWGNVKVLQVREPGTTWKPVLEILNHGVVEYSRFTCGV